MKSTRVIYTVLLLMLITSLNIYAQEQPPMRGPAAERIEQFKKVRLMEALKMNEETSIRFFARYNKYSDVLRDIQKDHNVLIDKLQEINKSNANNSDIEQTIKDIGMNEEKVAETRSKFLEELKSMISVRQIADYIIFERNFNRNLREIMRDIAKERWNRQR